MLRHLDKKPISDDAGEASLMFDQIRFRQVQDWGWKMKLVTGLLAVVLLLAGFGTSHAVVRIGEDRGGRIGT